MIERELIDFMLTSACRASILASQKIMEIYQSGEFDVNMRSNNSLITAADTQSHNAIKSYLSKTRIPLLSEEGRNMLYEERYRWDLYWLVDPLDGTREFVLHNGEFVVCIALMYNSKPLLGVIAVPEQGKVYFSDPDRGSFCIDDITTMAEEITITELFKYSRKLQPTRDVGSEKLRIIATRSHMNQDTESIINKQRDRYREVEITECGSALKFCRLAEGEFDCFFRMNSMYDWDVAAAEALLKGVGAKIKLISDDSDILYNKETLVVAPHYLSLKKVTL